MRSTSPFPASASADYVRDQLRINMRTGPGVQFRILGVLKTGDSVEVVSRGDGWTQVRGPEVDNGWIPEGYLQTEAPARIRLERHEAETIRTAKLENRIERLEFQVHKHEGPTR